MQGKFNCITVYFDRTQHGIYNKRRTHTQKKVNLLTFSAFPISFIKVYYYYTNCVRFFLFYLRFVCFRFTVARLSMNSWIDSSCIAFKKIEVSDSHIKKLIDLDCEVWLTLCRAGACFTLDYHTGVAGIFYFFIMPSSLSCGYPHLFNPPFGSNWYEGLVAAAIEPYAADHDGGISHRLWE